MHNYFTRVIMIKNILIIGSGKLGLSLAQSLSHQGFETTATTTTHEKVSKDNNINPAIIYLNTNTSDHNALVNTLHKYHFNLMIITIPPNRQLNNYDETLNKLHQLAISLEIKKVLFISSTSVWGENSGEVDENTPMIPITQSAKSMVRFEQTILNEPSFEASTIKLAGLIGETRNPGRFLAGKENLTMAKAPVNLVTQRDVIGIIIEIVKQNAWQKSFIACAPSHPTRDVFYVSAANKLNLVAPTFDYTNENLGQRNKIIDGSSTAAQLNYQYQDDNLIDWLHYSS